MNTQCSKYPLIIAGSRNFNDIRLMFKEVKSFCQKRNIKPSDIEIISGGAEGADKMGEFIAKHFSSHVKYFIPSWDTHGQMAGFIRNEQMASYASERGGGCIIFWDGVSNGSKHMIKTVKSYGLDYKVVNYGG